MSELEHIKTALNKDQSVKYTARQLLHTLDENQDKWECLRYNTDSQQVLDRFKYDSTNDTKILATAYLNMNTYQGDNHIFITNDLALKMLARPLFGATNIQSIKIENDDYVGYKEFYFTEEEMAYFYSNPVEYGKDLYINEYINIYIIYEYILS